MPQELLTSIVFSDSFCVSLVRIRAAGPIRGRIYTLYDANLLNFMTPGTGTGLDTETREGAYPDTEFFTTPSAKVIVSGKCPHY